MRLHNFTALWVNNNPSVDGFQDYFKRKPCPEDLCLRVAGAGGGGVIYDLRLAIFD